MTIRLFSQWLTFFISIAILVMSLAGAYLRPERRLWLLISGMYAMIDIVFYTVILLIGSKALGNDLSPYRAAMQDAIVLAVLYRYLKGDFVDWIKQWT